MTKTKQIWRLAKLPLAVSLASTLAAPAFGVTFNIGEIEGQFDSSMSVSALAGRCVVLIQIWWVLVTVVKRPHKLVTMAV
jgi:hypothetical protein